MNEDPGWSFTWKSVPFALVPRLAIRRAAKQPGANCLGMIRQLFVSFAVALVLITLAALILATSVQPEAPQPAIAAGIVVGAGVVGLIAGRRLNRRLDCSTDVTLADSYRQRFFLRMAFAQSAALVGFAVSISLGPWWVYVIGLGFATIGMVMLAPTRRHLASEQNELTANGCQRSLTRVLSSQPVEPNRWNARDRTADEDRPTRK